MVKLLEFLITITFLSMLPITLSSWSNLSFTFLTFDPNIKTLSYNGNASPSDKRIDLTTNQKDKPKDVSIGRVTYNELFHLWDNLSGKLADFSTNFTFKIDSLNDTSHASGMTFFLAPKDFPLPDSSSGSGLGLVPTDQTLNSTDYPFLAVEFDTYPSIGLDEISDDHVGIDISSMKSEVYTIWNSSILDGKTNQACISYDSSTMNLSVTFTGFQQGNQFIQGLSYVVDLRKVLPEWVEIGFSAATGDFFEIHTLESWRFMSKLEVNDAYSPSSPPETINSPDPDPGNRNKLRLAIGLTVTVACIFLIGWVGFICLKKTKMKMKKRSKKEDVDHVFILEAEFEQRAGPKRFSYDALVLATENFSEKRKLGQGGFGGVYEGFLLDLKLNIAVKKISSESKQGIKEYASEVKIISRVRHKNLVQLIGWCHEKGELLLVYELMVNGSLDHHLFRSENVLSWALRYKIACGLASALLYLHEEWDQAVLHRDVKSSNVMLDSDFNAKLGDFGLAKLVDHGKGSATTVLAGTLGYMAPECFSTSKASTESDVYSFGIVCLEIACGRKPIDPSSEEHQIRLVNWVWSLYGERKIMQALDPRLADSDYVDAQVECLMVLGLWCAHPDYCFRPSMKQATSVLNFEAPLPRLPLKFPVATYTSFPFSTEASEIIGSSNTQASSNTGVSSIMYTSTSSEDAYSSTTVLLSQTR